MIRKANITDLPGISSLLEQVLMVHYNIRPDLFIPNTRKYNDAEFAELLADPGTPVFVYTDGNGKILGHAFCALKNYTGFGNMVPHRSLYIDDICVDEDFRGQHIATRLLEYVRNYAMEQGCYNVTLNVWEGNEPARRFYENMGMGVQRTTMELILTKNRNEADT